jgi:hypothetical protein
MKPGLAWSIAIALAIAATTPEAARPPSASVTLRVDPRYTAEWVARSMGIALKGDVALPTVHLASATPLRRFQDAVEPQWGLRPRQIFNAYVMATNEIYLDDVSDYYRRRNRTLDESLAHELVHYLQVRYLRDDLASDASELEAVTVQQAFREIHAAQAN